MLSCRSALGRWLVLVSNNFTGCIPAKNAPAPKYPKPVSDVNLVIRLPTSTKGPPTATEIISGAKLPVTEADLDSDSSDSRVWKVSVGTVVQYVAVSIRFQV